MLIASRNSASAAEGWDNPYVTDGLVAMWDGEWNAGGGVHDPNATVWRDLSGKGWDATFVGNLNGHWTNNSFTNDFSSSHFTTDFKVLSGNFTVESACEIIGGSAASSVFSSRIESVESFKGFQLRLFNNTYGFVYADKQSNTRTVTTPTKGNSFVFTNEGDVNKFFKDGTLALSNSDGFTTNRTILNNTLSLGEQRSLQPTYFAGSIYSIRFYNRSLTAEEVTANYAVDKARFNLP